MSDSLWNIILKRYFTEFGQKFRVWPKELPKRFPKLVISVTLCQKFWSDLKILRIEIENASTYSKRCKYTSGKKKQCISNIATKIKECEGKAKLWFYSCNFTHSQKNCFKLCKSRHAYHTSDVWKYRGANFSFTHSIGHLFIAGINSWKAYEHGWFIQITKQGFRSNVQ